MNDYLHIPSPSLYLSTFSGQSLFLQFLSFPLHRNDTSLTHSTKHSDLKSATLPVKLLFWLASEWHMRCHTPGKPTWGLSCLGVIYAVASPLLSLLLALQIVGLVLSHMLRCLCAHSWPLFLWGTIQMHNAPMVHLRGPFKCIMYQWYTFRAPFKCIMYQWYTFGALFKCIMYQWYTFEAPFKCIMYQCYHSDSIILLHWTIQMINN